MTGSCLCQHGLNYFRAAGACQGVGDRVLPIASTLQHLHFPQCSKQHSSG